MLWQIGLLSISAYMLYKDINKDKIKFRNTLREICEKSEGFFNRQYETLKVREFEVTEYGYEVNIGVPFGLSFKTIEDKLDLFKTNLGAEDIEITRDKHNSIIHFSIIKKPFKDLRFKPQELQPYEIYIGYTHKQHLIINLNSFPHLLIGGSTGTGKSRLMLCILTNLIHRHKEGIEIYLVQIRKGDLTVFEDCHQVKYFAKNLEKAYEVLRYIDNLCQERDRIIERYIKNGIFNISDYNKRFKANKMSYVYVSTDEFSFFMPSKADSSKEKALKAKCIAYIKNIVRVGRSVGIFLFTSLQLPNKSSIPQDIKSELNLKVSFRQLYDSSSIAILGHGGATDLEVREAIIQTSKEEKFKVPYIDYKIIKEYTKASKEEGHKYINLNNTKENIKIPLIKELTLPQLEAAAANNKNENNGVINISKLKELRKKVK